MSWSMRCWRRADHDVAVGLERLLERRRVVALDPVDDRRPRRRPDRSRARPPTRAALFVGELLLADLEDRVGVEAVEGPQRDELVVALAPERPVVGRRRRATPRASRRTRRAPSARRRTRPGQPAPLGAPAGPRRRRRSRRGTTGRSRGRLDLEPLPEPDLRDTVARVCACVEEGRDRLEPAGDRSRAARGAARSRGRRAGTARRRRRRAPSSGAPRSGPPRCRRSAAGGCGSRGRARSGAVAESPAGSIASIAARWRRLGVELARAPRRATPSPSRSSSVWMPDVRPEDRVVADEPPEAGLDEVVERVVERAGVAAGARAGEDDVLESIGHEVPPGRPRRRRRAARSDGAGWTVPGGSSRTATGGAAGAVASRAARDRRSTIVSMSSAAMP